MAENSSRCEPLPTPLLCLTSFDAPMPARWLAAQIAQLTPAESAHLAAIDRPRRREQFVVGRHLLRWALTAVGLCDARVEVGPDWRPLVRGSSPAYASIAHSASRVAVVVADAPVGVDLESRQRLRDPAAAAALLGVAADDDCTTAVLRKWAAAEARLKAGVQADARTWHCAWHSCQLAVAGSAKHPFTFVFDLTTEIYNVAELDWEST
ncbi:MAG: hypothetical protein ABJA83_05215 [Burkholderiaceae bacterium]